MDYGFLARVSRYSWDQDFQNQKHDLAKVNGYWTEGENIADMRCLITFSMTNNCGHPSSIKQKIWNRSAGQASFKNHSTALLKLKANNSGV